jgi:SSS family solute:Na+ symporter
MSSADSNLLCMSTMVMNDLVFGNGFCKDMEDKKVLLTTRIMNIVFAVCAMGISMLGISIVTMNTFAFGIRCAGPFAAYGLGMMVEKATKNAGVLSIITGTIGFIFWQALSGGSFLFGILPVVFGCAIGTATFFIVNAIELKAGKPIAPSAFVEE